MKGTDCFDPKTLEMLAKLAQNVSREMTPEAFDRIVQQGLLRPFIAGMKDPGLVSEMISVLNGEAVVSGPGRDGEIVLKSDGRTGEEWVDHFGGQLSPGAKKLLQSRVFVPTAGVRYKVHIVPGCRTHNSVTRTPHGVRFGTKQDKPMKTSLELGCLLREAMTTETFKTLCGRLRGGKGIVVVHRPDEPRAPREQPENRYLIANYGQTNWGHVSLVTHHMQPLTNYYLFAFCTEMKLPG